MMNLKVLVMVIKTDRAVREDAAKLRGFIGNSFPEYLLLHHHIDYTDNLYTYPRVQYKIISGTPLVIGVEDGVDVLKEISDDLEELKLGRSIYRIKSLQMNQFNADFGKCRENIRYRFLTPWLALNSGNYERYRCIRDWKEKKEFLNSILVGNILSMSKGLNYIVMGKLYAHSLIDEDRVRYKAISHTGFMGEFKINFRIPDLLGIGKAVSHGFGTIKRVSKDDSKKDEESSYNWLWV